MGQIVLGTTFMVLWDISLDPTMNQAFPFWSHAADGVFFGMPFSNWGGWFGVTLVILVGYEWIRGDRPVQNLGAASLTNARSAGCGEPPNPKRPIECALDIMTGVPYVASTNPVH